MASQLRHEFKTDLGTAVFETAAQLLTSVRHTSLQAPELLSVRQAWSAIDHSSWRGQLKAGPTLALVTALRRAHDAADAPVFWPTPQEAQEELSRAKKRRGGTRDAGVCLLIIPSVFQYAGVCLLIIPTLFQYDYACPGAYFWSVVPKKNAERYRGMRLLFAGLCCEMRSARRAKSQHACLAQSEQVWC